MKKVQFKKVGMKNYGPYIDPLEYIIEPNMLTLITGPNGVGKTMSLDAIPYTLYGMRSNGARGDDVVNQKIGKNCHTWVEFLIDNDEYRVDRYHKYSKLGNTVILKKNGVDINKGHKDVLPVIESLILPRTLFMNTIMFGQKVRDFFTDLTDSDKKEIFRKVLALEEYITYYEKTNARLKEYKEAIQQLDNDSVVNERLLLETQKKIQEQNTKKKEYYERKERQLTEYRNQIATQDRILSELEQKFVGYEKEEELLQNVMEKRARVQSEINQVNQKYQSMFSELKSSSDNKELQLRGQVSELKRDVEKQYTSDIDTLREDINDLTSRYNKEIEKEKSNKHKSEIAIATLESNEAKYLTEQEEYVNALESDQKICPTCGQELKNKDHLEYKLQSVSEAAEKCQAAIIKYKKQINAIDKDIMVITKEFEDNKSAIQSEIDVLFDERNEKLFKLDFRLDTALQKIQNLFTQKKVEIQSQKNYEEKELSEMLSKAAEEQKSLAEHVHSMKDIEKNIASQKQQRDQVQSWIDRESKEEFDDTELKRAEHQEQSYEIAIQQINQQIEGLNRKKTICEFWKKAFSQTGIPSMLIDESIPFMNERVAYYLDKISNGRYIVSFDTLAETKSGEFRDKISVNVLDTHTQANSRVQLSGGQTRLVDIATILTLSDLQSSTQDVDFNIMLFDEIFDSLDDTNVGYVSRVIRSMISDKSIFIISHRHVDQLEADEVYNYG